MKNIPNKIYLQINPEREDITDFKELREVTWCKDRINENDLEYILNKKTGNETRRIKKRKFIAI